MKAIRQLISIFDLNDDQIRELVSQSLRLPPRTCALDPHKKAIGLLFLEPSTRTRISFERAAQSIGRHSILMDSKGTSVEKGESLADTLRTLAAYGVGTFVIRTPYTGSLKELVNLNLGPVINAGDGVGEHPTQALLDLVTLAETFGQGQVEKLRGLRLAIMGDLRRSRVARSWSHLAPRLGIDVTFVSPPAWKPEDWRQDFAWTASKAALREAQVVMALRVQKERMTSLDPEIAKKYVADFQIVPADLKDNQKLMHPGPVNWGIELHEGWIQDPRSLIGHQLRNGFLLRSTLLENLDEE